MNAEIESLEKQMYELSQKLMEARSKAEPEPVEDYELMTTDGPKKLSEFFGDQRDLILIHNMGASCSYCTLWADGFTDMQRHIRERCAFVLVSPDSPENQKKLAAARGWEFPMAQDADARMTSDMGFLMDGKDWWPGMSAFTKDENGQIYRTGKSFFGPGDSFCPVWHFFSFLKDGANGWEPH